MHILFGEIEAGEQQLEKAREGLETYRRAVLKAAISGELTQDWRERNPPNESGANHLVRILRERHAIWQKVKLTDAMTNNGTSKRRVANLKYDDPEASNVSDLPDLPRGWVWATVDQVCWLMQYGSSAKCSTEDDGVPVLRMANIQAGLIDYTRLKHLPWDHHEFPQLFLANGDVLFNRTNSAELVGKTAVYDGACMPCSFASYLIRLRLVGIMPEYFAYYLNSAYGRAWIVANKTQQVGQANVSGGKLKRMCIPVPPEVEQREIVRRAEASFAAATILDNDETIWSGSISLRQSILTSAFSGKLVPQDPNDEPATELLARLRAGKAATSAIRRTKPRRFQKAAQ